MYYYQLNIGDYQSHTNHLDDLEDLAYRRLLDWCYLHEKPLPNDIEEISRLIRLRNETERIKMVLREFFEHSDEGYYSHRVNKEIEHYHSKIEQASRAGKASAERRFNGRSTDVQLTNNQEPITNNQEPLNTLLVKTDKQFSRLACPADELLQIFHDECKALPRVMMLNTTRKKHLVSRWRDVDAEDNLKTKDEGLMIFRQIFQRVQKSDFLSGRTMNRNGRVWKASFDWLILPTNFLKVCEGQYDNGRK